MSDPHPDTSAHEHEFVTTPYDAYELRCADPDCYTAQILPGNPRYCPLTLAGTPHAPHTLRYSYTRYREETLTYGATECDGIRPIPDPLPHTSADLVTVPAAAGGALVVQSYHARTDGTGFLAAVNDDGHLIARLDVEEWTDLPADRIDGQMRLFWLTAGAVLHPGIPVDPQWGEELVWTAATGAQVRLEPTGTAARVVHSDGTEVDDGSAYWVNDEWREAPAEVIGALIGALVGAR